MARHILPSAAMERILKNAGSKRVSADAKIALRDAVEEKIESICSKAIKFAEHSGRKTIKPEDIKLAKR